MSANNFSDEPNAEQHGRYCNRDGQRRRGVRMDRCQQRRMDHGNDGSDRTWTRHGHPQRSIEHWASYTHGHRDDWQQHLYSDSTRDAVLVHSFSYESIIYGSRWHEHG